MVTYSEIIIGAWIVFWVFLYVPAIFDRVPADRRSSRYLKQSFMVFLLAMVLVVFLEWYEPGLLSIRIVPDTPIVRITVVILTFAGLGFSAWARILLGRYWSNLPSIKVGHQLIRAGPYRFVRNPMYTGILVASTGAAIGIGFFFAFVALGFLVVVVWVKIASEEEILLEKFGEEYLQYKKDVKVALIPFLV
jgi:protein-S-isoprenylcysteine O-methyltransferase Ste14